ncbi:aromatase/cyclase [Streptomyces sp. ISL-36]|uniref:aromatase/cyclase n=1 Tax=Streptomyces sp. ISL-36 TaxID=2819182 RepID=UPI001BE5EB8F|nr:aromatase/cyclase [Streptomyces sp. ISL-36]MBT2444505.1 aromatase/cyclase [Streptomyces sp. ISL-36]
MNPAGVRQSAHETTVAAPAATVHRLISEVENWPRTFPATVHVAHEEAPEGEQRLRVWDTADGDAAPRSWGLRRIVQDAELRVNFELLTTEPPLASLGGAWLVEPLGENSSRVRLLQEFRAAGDDPAELDRIAERVARDAVAQLAALKENVEFAHGAQEVTFSFEDTVHIDGSAKDVYDFVNEAGLWSERLPHVASVRLTEDTPGVQTLEMDTRAKDGSVHTTKSYRVTFPHHKIAYKQVTLPALMTLHTGYWTFRETETGVAASSQHTVTLNTDNITRILGPDATVADARAYVHTALSTNSRATLNHAKTHAETGAETHAETRH